MTTYWLFHVAADGLTAVERFPTKEAVLARAAELERRGLALKIIERGEDQIERLIYATQQVEEKPEKGG